MGLDQYAYVAAREKQQHDFYDQEGLEFDSNTSEWHSPPGGVEKPRELAYWRKHPNLQGWMEALYRSKGGTGEFNGDELELTWDDLDRLEQDIKSGSVSRLGTSGFFFGDPSDNYYQEQDLAFVEKAKAEVFCGLRVFYNSSW
jgi:hypothetical protein